MAWHDLPQKHPYLWFYGCILIIDFPQWFQSVWSLFSTDAPFPYLWRLWKKLNLPEFSPYWITVPLGIVMFIWLLLELRAQRQKKSSQVETTPIKQRIGIKAMDKSVVRIVEPDLENQDISVLLDNSKGEIHKPKIK